MGVGSESEGSKGSIVDMVWGEKGGYEQRGVIRNAEVGWGHVMRWGWRRSGRGRGGCSAAGGME
eukprot:751320-Hanusia_phi.AAC.1